VKKPIIVVLLAGLPFAVGAQERSDLMPAPPAGGGGWVYPGAPLPTAPPEPAQSQAPRSSDGKPDSKAQPSGLVLFDSGGGDDPDAQPTVEQSGESYVVKKGDTLWSISAAYLRTPWAWPKLWSYNVAITNPHWIYPGDLIHLGPVGDAPAPTAANPTPQPVARTPERSHGLMSQQHGFVEPDELESAGTIIASKEEKIMLARLDEAYIEYKKQKPLELGKRYSIYKPIRTVKHPVTGKRLGEIVEIFGDAEIKTITSGNIARGLILESHNPIERGYRVGPLRKVFRETEPRVANKDVDGLVVATLRPVDIVGAYTLVFLDRGKSDGVEVGNRFQVIRRGDGYQPLGAVGPVDDKRYPREIVGEIIVVELRNGLATGVMTRSTKEVNIGEKVEMRKGF